MGLDTPDLFKVWVRWKYFIGGLMLIEKFVA